MRSGNGIGPSFIQIAGILGFLIFFGCVEGNPSTGQNPWTVTGGTGGISGSTEGGLPQTGTGGQTAGGTGGSVPVAGTGGSIPTGGSGGAAATGGTGGQIDITDGGKVDGGGGSGATSGTGGAGGTGGTPATGGTGGSDVIGGCEVTAVPDNIRSSYGLNQFYQKYADANGLPVATSSLVSDEAITLACQLVKEMVSLRDDVRQALISGKMRFTLIAASEQLSSIPEVNAMYGTMYDQRARGLGGMIPTICAEENILCQVNIDRWRGENICVHEYSHTMMNQGLVVVDPTFNSRLNAAYQAAQLAGTFANTYAISKASDFWAEGCQDWYNSNQEAIPTDGIHNSINTRAELKQASPELYDLIAELLPENTQFDDCYAVQ